MPPELLELYQLYQQEVASRNEKEANYLTELNVMLRSPSMLSLRGPEFEERTEREGRLPPIRPEEADLLFHRQGDLRGDLGDIRADSRMSINSPETDSLRSHLPSIESDREDSARYSQQIVG